MLKLTRALFVLVSFLFASELFAQRTAGFQRLILDDGAMSSTYFRTLSGSLAISENDVLPITCALLDLSSATKGFLPPRLTQAARNAIITNCPLTSEGMIVYNTTTNTLDYWDGSVWVNTNSGWQLTGNSGTIDGLNFVGTIDNVPITLRVGNLQVARYQRQGASVNVTHGRETNAITSGVLGGTISGGGEPGADNIVTDDYGTVGGGVGNQAGNNVGTTSDATYASISGGQGNIASGTYAVIGGGFLNNASAQQTTIAGGYRNIANNINATVSGGSQNQAINNNATVAGGGNNIAGGNSSVVGGGDFNQATSTFTTIAGGGSNRATVLFASALSGFSNDATSDAATIAGGTNNTASGGGSFIGGGESNIASNTQSIVVGGQTNNASGLRSFIGGGVSNNASGQNNVIAGGTSNSATGIGSAILGGLSNFAQNTNSVVVGGESNRAGNAHGFVGGGQNNFAQQQWTTIAGGRNNNVTAQYGFIGGGFGNIANDGAVATGGEANIANGLRSFIGAGASNQVNFSAAAGAIAGGGTNIVNGLNGFIGAGQLNTVGGTYGSIIAGSGNTNNGDYSSLVGGNEFTMSATADRSFGFHGGGNGISLPLTLNTANTGFFGNVDVWIGGNDNIAHELRFYESNNGTGNFPPAGINYTSFRASGQGADFTYNLPGNAPVANAVLTSSGGATSSLSWSTPYSSIAAAAAIVIPNADVVNVSNDAANVAINATLPVGFNGQKLIIANNDALNAVATGVGAPVAPATAASYVFAGGAWFRII